MDNHHNHLKTQKALSQISKDMFIIQYFLLYFLSFFILAFIIDFWHLLCLSSIKISLTPSILDRHFPTINLFIASHQSSKLDFLCPLSYLPPFSSLFFCPPSLIFQQVFIEFQARIFLWIWSKIDPHSSKLDSLIKLEEFWVCFTIMNFVPSMILRWWFYSKLNKGFVLYISNLEAKVRCFWLSNFERKVLSPW